MPTDLELGYNVPSTTLPDSQVSSATWKVRKLFGGSTKKDSLPTVELTEVNAESLEESDLPQHVSKLRLVAIIGQPSIVNFFSSYTTGIVTVALPTIARALDISPALYLWPSSIYGLTSGSMLLIAGAIADVVGPRSVEIIGVTLLGIFTLACGFSMTGVQLVVFRALQGIAMAMHLPASVSLVAAGVPEGRPRNFGFACLGLSQTIGFSAGMVTSGIMIDKVGWRLPFFVSAGGIIIAAAMAFWTSPRVILQKEMPMSRALLEKVDWIGGALASAGLALFFYVLAVLSADLQVIKSGGTITMLIVSILLMTAFPFWTSYRGKSNRQALVPNTFWKISAFSSTCIMVALSYGVQTAMEVFSSLFFQEIQHKSAFTTSLYLMPTLVVGVLLIFTISLFVHKLSAQLIVAVFTFLCAIGPLMMALVDPSWSYWRLEFWAQVFAPIAAEVLFTVGLILVSESFPSDTQGLAGAVFNTVAQLGQALGVGICQVVALSVAGPGALNHGGGKEVRELLRGYRAAFWTMFGYMLLCGIIAVVGLRKVGKVGQKKEKDNNG